MEQADLQTTLCRKMKGFFLKSIMTTQLNPLERSISTRLALVFALRMFGLFIVLPIFVPYAHTLSGGDSATWVGLAMGAYGLMQAFLYILYGVASDKFGRKPLIVIGLLIFAAGAVWAAYADNIYALAAARALQGAGAISSVLVAMVGDNTRVEVRTRAMAMVGMSIALTFALSLIVAPLLFVSVGMFGIFIAIALLSMVAILIIWRLPHQQQTAAISSWAGLKSVLRDTQQWRLNFGVFVLHAVQMAMWVVIPQRLAAFNIGHSASAWLYAAVIALSMAVMVPLIIRAEKHHKMQSVMTLSIVLVAVALVLLAADVGGVWCLSAALLLFFIGFNVLEATQPSLLSKRTSFDTKGAAAGVYNTVQALGLFVGAFFGAVLNQHLGALVMFGCAAALTLVWLAAHVRHNSSE